MEFLLAEFSVSKNIQVSPTKLCKNGRRVHYIRMGFPVQDNPTVIRDEYKKKNDQIPTHNNYQPFCSKICCSQTFADIEGFRYVPQDSTKLYWSEYYGATGS
jgi:hypothetical protein